MNHPLKHLIPGYGSIDCSDATKDVTLLREELDVLTGKRGSPEECADARCCWRLKDSFPHPFIAVEICRSRAYVIDKVDRYGGPVHCVRYVRSKVDREDILRFDKGKPINARREITLYAPRPSQRTGKAQSRSPGSNRKRKHVRKGLARGAVARLLAAGLIVPTQGEAHG